MCLVDPGEQAVQSRNHEDKPGEPNDFAYDAEAENEFGSRYLTGGGGSISGYDEAGGNIQEAKTPEIDVNKYSNPATLAAFLVEFMPSLLLLTPVA